MTISVFLCPMFTGVDSKEWCGKAMGLYFMTIQKDLGYHFLQIRETNVYYHFLEEQTFGKRSAKPMGFSLRPVMWEIFLALDSSSRDVIATLGRKWTK